ncbi:hypothetical protein, partial [Lentibacter algarum]|uniref:hypothetical protein n=1 Tax=Lentibacter algarum TaxID=576131 RepID=UPI002492C40A
MAYIKTYDERSYGTYVNSSSGDRDAPGSLNSNYTLAAGESAYGTLTYNNLADIDVYSLGSLSAGSYLLDVNAYTWDFSNVGYGGISSFQLLNSYGGIVETSYSTASDIEFTVNSTSTYYVKVVGNYYDDQQYSATYSRNDDITPVGDVTAPTLSAVYINGTEFAEGDTVVGSITAFDTSGIAYADIQYLFPTGDYDYLELTDPDGDGTFTASDLIDATVPEGSYLAKSIYIQDASTNQNYVEYRYDGSVYINDTLQSTNHTFDFSKLDFDIVDDDITPVGDVTAPTLSAVYINGTEFAEGDTVVGSITAFDTSGIAYADIQYLFPTGDYDYLELTDPDGDGTFTASDLIDATVPEGSYLAKNIYIQDASTNQNYVEYRYDGSVYINDTLQSTNHTFDFSKLDFDIVDDDTPPSLPAFDIRMTSSDNGTASFAIYANELVDPDGDGIGAFEFTLSHDPSDLLVDVGSIAAASGFFGVPNYNATTGVLELGGI